MAGAFEYDHDLPCSLGGEASLGNCVVACKNCHQDKTSTRDIPVIAKSNRQRNSHLGIKAKGGRPMPGTKASGLRKRMDGRVERR